MSRSIFLPCLSLFLLTVAFCCVNGAPRRIKTGKETWSYVTVRDGAYMFFWLYYTTADVDYKTRPLVLWLQGGPGASSTGIGNFLEIGPQDEVMNNRTNAWTEQVNVLFVDNPVGTGFSYVNNTSLLPNNNSAVADDLVSFMKGFLKKVPEFETVPLYIFAESYGGKMAVKFAQALRKAVEAQKINCQLAGVALGDSWISPVDAVDSWGPYLYATSLVDSVGLSQINNKAKAVASAVAAGSMHNATMLWSETEELVEKVTNGVNFYNILSPPENSNSSTTFEDESQDIMANTPEPHPNHIMSPFINPEENRPPAPKPHHKFSSRQIGRHKGHSLLSRNASLHVNDTKFDLSRKGNKHHKPKDRAPGTVHENHFHWRMHKSRFNHRISKHGYYKHDYPQVIWQPAHIKYLFNRRVGKISEVLDKLMNGPIKEKLKIIPQNVTWGGQSASVFEALSADFMASAVGDVEMLLNNTAIKVVVYNGQLDLIVDTPGVEKWVENLQWAGTKQWLAAPRRAIESASGGTAAFTKSYKNFSFYWIMDAGHMVPADNSDIALKVMKEIVGVKDH